MKIAAKYFLCVMLMGGCVATDINRLAEFPHYQTFAWGKSRQNVQNPIYRGGLIDDKIKMTIKEELTKKGLVFRKSRPDILVSYETYTETQERYAGPGYAPYYAPYPFLTYTSFGYGWGPPYAWYSIPTGFSYTEGTLVIDVYDRRTGKQIWRGSVSDDLDNPEKIGKQIQKGVHAIIRKFPAGTPPPPPEIPVKEKTTARAGQGVNLKWPVIRGQWSVSHSLLTTDHWQLTSLAR